MMKRIYENLSEWPIIVDEELIKSVHTELVQAKISNCTLANELWYLKQFMLIRMKYVEIFDMLQKKQYSEAWSSLADLENTIIMIKDTYEIPNIYHIDYILEYIHKIQRFYPYKFFTSREEIVKELKCGICGAVVNPAKSCGHEAGKIYCGELCTYEITKLEFISLAIVENPFDKYAVIKLNDKEHNYDLLDFLMNGLSDAFEEWEYIEKLVPKPEFKNAFMKKPCPCGSNKKYKHCCYGKEHTLMPHIEVVIKNPKKKLGDNIIISNGLWKDKK